MSELFGGYDYDTSKLFNTSKLFDFNKNKKNSAFDFTAPIGTRFAGSPDFFDYAGKTNFVFDQKDNNNFLLASLQQDQNPGFFDKDNYKSYLESVKEDKSDLDKQLDFDREMYNKDQSSPIAFPYGSVGTSQLAENLVGTGQDANKIRTVIPGKEGSGKSFMRRMAGGIGGLAKGMMPGVPHGGAYGFASGFLS